MLKNRLIYLTAGTCTPLIIIRTLQRKLIVKINSMKGKNLSIMAMIVAVFCSCGQQPAQERGPRPVKLGGSDLVKQDRKIVFRCCFA